MVSGLENIRLSSQLAVRCGESFVLRRFKPKDYQLFVDRAIQGIALESQSEEIEAWKERDYDILGSAISQEREQLLYYSFSRKSEATRERLFGKYLPFEHRQALHVYGFSEGRWDKGAIMAPRIQGQFQVGLPGVIGRVDYRGKSLFSLWTKAWWNRLDFDEIFDGVAIRVTVQNKEIARRLKDVLLSQNQLIPEHYFRHIPGQVHHPLVDTLDTPASNGFASIRMNFHDSDIGKYEVQIQTLEDYLLWRQAERAALLSQAVSVKYGLLFDGT